MQYLTIVILNSILFINLTLNFRYSIFLFSENPTHRVTYSHMFSYVMWHIWPNGMPRSVSLGAMSPSTFFPLPYCGFQTGARRPHSWMCSAGPTQVFLGSLLICCLLWRYLCLWRSPNSMSFFTLINVSLDCLLSSSFPVFFYYILQLI